MHTKTVQVWKTLYVSDDGHEFETEEACREYEITKDYVTQAQKYFDEHAVMDFYPHEDRIAQYMNFDGYEGVLIMLDDFVLEWLDFLSTQDYASEELRKEEMKAWKGEYIFLCYPCFTQLNDWVFTGTLDDAIFNMNDDIETLDRIKRGESK